MIGVKTEFLVDTGSTYTIVDSSFYDSIPESKRPLLEKVNLILKNANGEVMNVLGQTCMELEVQGQCLNVPVKVVSLGDKSTILGLDFMEEQECIFNVAKGTMKSNGHIITMHKKGSTRCARIQARETIFVPAKHEMIINGTVKSNHWVSNFNIGLIEPKNRLTDNTGLLVAKSLVRVEHNTVPIRIANFGLDPIKVNKGSTVALLEPVKEICKFEPEPQPFDKIIGSVSKIEDGCLPELPEYLKPLVEQSTETLPGTELTKLTQLLYKYQDIFKSPDGQLGRTNLVKHRIDTGNAVPIKQRPRRLPVSQIEAVDKELDKMEAEGIIEASDSPWSSPLVIVTKKNGDLRVCVDYRAVNEVMRKSAVPLPKIQECLDSLSGSKYFCTMDLAQGYYQVAMHPDDKCKTAFTSRRGLRQFTVMPFGLTNAPGTFMHLMQLVLSGLQWTKAVLYLDDIITFGTTCEETLENLELVFQRLRKAGLVLKPSKCKFFQKSVEFLGHVVSQEGISCDPNKLEAIKNWPQPQKVKDIRSFLGLASYYRKYIRSFASIAAPLNALTKKNVKFVWDDKCELAFKELKDKLSHDPIVLAYPNKEGTFVLDTDASLYGVGGVLSQIQEDGQEKVISYASKTLSKTQQNYCTTMRELLASVVFIKHFHHYLWGRKFILRTDHASLKWLVNFREPEGMLARWLSVLSSYDFETQHRKGALHSNADGLSRQPPRKCKRGDCEDCALSGDNCVCVITRGQTERLKGQGQIGVKSNVSTSIENSCDVPVGNAPRYEKDKNVPSTSSGQTFGNDPTSIVTSDNCDEISQGLSKRSKCKIKSNWTDSWSDKQLREAQMNDSNINRS